LAIQVADSVSRRATANPGQNCQPLMSSAFEQ